MSVSGESGPQGVSGSTVPAQLMRTSSFVNPETNSSIWERSETSAQMLWSALQSKRNSHVYLGSFALETVEKRFRLLQLVSPATNEVDYRPIRCKALRHIQAYFIRLSDVTMEGRTNSCAGAGDQNMFPLHSKQRVYTILRHGGHWVVNRTSPGRWLMKLSCVVAPLQSPPPPNTIRTTEFPPTDPVPYRAIDIAFGAELGILHTEIAL